MQTNIYEHPIWQDVPDQSLHPGGLTITQQALSFCELLPDMHVLDVGCGTGVSLNSLASMPGFVCYGVDASMKLLLQANQRKSQSKFVQAEAEKLPFVDESMSLILSECTLSLFNIQFALQEFSRVLKREGYFIISDLYARNENGINALRELPPGTCIRAAMTRTQITEELERCQLKVVAWQDCSDKLKNFPVCNLATAAAVDIFDLYVAAARAKLGYYFLVARKTA
jgi:ubiquinone/menaquinone biosynthesis C-methylase UbiE